MPNSLVPCGRHAESGGRWWLHAGTFAVKRASGKGHGRTCTILSCWEGSSFMRPCCPLTTVHSSRGIQMSLLGRPTFRQGRWGIVSLWHVHARTIVSEACCSRPAEEGKHVHARSWQLALALQNLLPDHMQPSGSQDHFLHVPQGADFASPQGCSNHCLAHVNIPECAHFG